MKGMVSEMADHVDITLWIDRRWKDAIEKHLRDETLEEHLEDVLDEASILQGISNLPARVKCAVLAWHTLKEAIEHKN